MSRDFSVLADVRPMIETFPLERAQEAYRKMRSGEARFRMVLTMQSQLDNSSGGTVAASR